ncbi:MAG: segregation and condensation protein B [Oleiphilaceae bacterium]|jgi:segregation and condensation protein B
MIDVELLKSINNQIDEDSSESELSSYYGQEALTKFKLIVEAILFASDKPLTIEQVFNLLEHDLAVSRAQIRLILNELITEYKPRGIELVEVGGAFRFQTRSEYSEWVQLLWEEKPQKYSRALLETLALIAYRQPITRGDIEEIRGVAVSSNIIKTLQERNWVRIVGHREVPGRPAIYATTKQFLAHFNLKTLENLPTLAEIRDIDLISREVNAQLALGDEFELNPETLDSEILNDLHS